MKIECRVCGNEAGNRTFRAREMMLGTRDPFDYSECGRCGSLQIVEIPEELARYYPHDYYSLKSAGGLELEFKGRWMAASLGTGGGWLGRFFRRLYGPHPVAEWRRHGGLRLDSRVLDVGCGDGRLLRTMRRAGFDDLTGVDPFLSAEEQTPGLALLARPLDALEGPFDFVMMHHSLEHVASPRAVLREAARLLPAGATALVRTPVADSHAWRKYGPDWVQLDAPRHLHVFSEPGLRLLARETGFEVSRVVHESTAFQFWGSELYARDIPYSPKPSYRNRPSRRLIPKEQMRSYAEQARVLNAHGEGDAAAFYLRRAEG